MLSFITTVLRVNNESFLSFSGEHILICAMLLGSSERQEVDGTISIEVADVGRTYKLDDKSEVCIQNLLGKTCGKVATLITEWMEYGR